MHIYYKKNTLTYQYVIVGFRMLFILIMVPGRSFGAWKIRFEVPQSISEAWGSLCLNLPLSAIVHLLKLISFINHKTTTKTVKSSHPRPESNPEHPRPVTFTLHAYYIRRHRNKKCSITNLSPCHRLTNSGSQQKRIVTSKRPVAAKTS